MGSTVCGNNFRTNSVEESKGQGEAEPPQQLRNTSTTNTSSISSENNDNESDNSEFVLFQGCDQNQFCQMPNLDFMDLPLSGALVAVDGSLCDPAHTLQRIPVKTVKNCRLIRNDCVFCSKKIRNDEKIVELPCKHSLHFECIQKWIIISNPCKVCKA